MKQSTFWTICLFLLLSYSGYSQVTQELLQGEWVAVKTMRKDGSKLIDYGLHENMYMRYVFKGNSLLKYFSPVSVYGVYKPDSTGFKISGKKIVCSNSLEYSIELLHTDTLIISEINPAKNDNDLFMIYLLKKSILENAEKNLQKGKDTFQANKYAVPTLKLPIIDQNYHKEYAGRFMDAKITGWLYLDTKEKKVTVKIIHTNLNEKINQRVIDFFENTYEKWDISHFSEFNTIAVSFSFSVDMVYKYIPVKKRTNTKPGYNDETISIAFLVSTDRIFSPDKNNTTNNIAESKKYFAKGLKEIEKNNPEKALDQFKKSYELNPKNADALYNMGSIYFKLGDANAACACYLKLKNMGQREAAEIYDQYCKEHKAAENVRADNDNPDQ